MEQFELPFQGAERKPLTKEELLALPDIERRREYKKLIGQMPTHNLSDEQILEGILEPAKERSRVLAENLEEDRNDRGYYPTGK